MSYRDYRKAYCCNCGSAIFFSRAAWFIEKMHKKKKIICFDCGKIRIIKWKHGSKKL